MSSNLGLEERKCIERWYKLNPITEQIRLINHQARFKVVPAGRRSGKTERAKRYMAKLLMTGYNEHYFLAAPTHAQVKRIFWEDMKKLTFAHLLGGRAISETELIIRMPNGNTLTLIGLDKPERIEGAFWSGGIIDEIANVKESAWKLNIKPALDTFNPARPNYRPFCWLIGVPEGLNHYYDRAEYARTANDPDWELFTWHSSEVLPPDVIESAKRTMSAMEFRQEYEASFETAKGRIYADYSSANETTEAIAPHEQLLWMHDFNYTPLSSAVGVRRGKLNNDLYLLDEVVLESAVARNSAMEFVEKFKEHENRKVLLFGDPAGKAGEKHGHASDYNEIESVLRRNNWEVQRLVKEAHPRIVARQNSVRAKIKNAAGEISLFVNPAKANYCHKGLSTVQLKEGSAFQEEDSEFQHITTAIGYCVDRLWPSRYEEDESEIVIPAQTRHHW